MIVISSLINWCRVLKYISPFFSPYQYLHVTLSISIHTWKSHISLAHNIHKCISWRIYLTVKLHRRDEWKVPSQACMSSLTVSPVATLVASSVWFVKPVESDIWRRMFRWFQYDLAQVTTHWGRVTYIFSKLTIIGSDNGLSPHHYVL